MQRYVKSFIPFLSPLSDLAAPLGGAAAAEGQYAANALGMDCGSCDFDRARSRLIKVIKGAKEVACYPKTRCSPRSLARRLAPPLFLPAASSYLQDPAAVQLDKTDAACAEADAARPDEGFCHAAPRLSILRPPPPPSLPTYHFLCRDCAQTCGWSGGEGRDASRALGSDERATTTWAKRRAQPSRLHTKLTGAAVGAKAARGKAVRARARAEAGAGG
jgi:hypothetical protein